MFLLPLLKSNGKMGVIAANPIALAIGVPGGLCGAAIFIAEGNVVVDKITDSLDTPSTGGGIAKVIPRDL